nr:hypothetical protein [uncultured Draconibacterium sp.]
MEFKAAPDYETMKLMLIIAGSLLVIMLGVIGYLIRRKDESALTQITKIAGIVDTLSSTVTSLDKVVGIIKTQFDDATPRTEKRLNAHAERLDHLDKKVAIIETRCEVSHKVKSN